jgi:hypothetical protein
LPSDVDWSEHVDLASPSTTVSVVWWFFDLFVAPNAPWIARLNTIREDDDLLYGDEVERGSSIRKQFKLDVCDSLLNIGPVSGLSVVRQGFERACAFVDSNTCL